MSKIWYTSDLHIGHKLVSGLRGFFHEDESSQEFGLDPIRVPVPDAHDKWLADVWDSVVKAGDQVFVLGDISINGGQRALDWIEARPGTKHLISGNHDPVHPMYRSSLKDLPRWLKYFETIQPFLRRKLVGHEFFLSHFPYLSVGDGVGRGDARYAQYRLPELGLPLLHGHTHSASKHEGPLQLHVGIDAWGRLVDQEEVITWLESL